MQISKSGNCQPLHRGRAGNARLAAGCAAAPSLGQAATGKATPGEDATPLAALERRQFLAAAAGTIACTAALSGVAAADLRT